MASTMVAELIRHSGDGDNGVDVDGNCESVDDVFNCDEEPKMVVEANDSSSKSPARGLEIIYKVAEELATRIADEKRYEGIIKPCSVKILRISDTTQYKIIRNPDLILNEDINKQLEERANGFYEDMQTEYYELSDDEEEMIVPEEPKGVEETDAFKKASFFCIFCPEKNIIGLSKASEHYQSHMDYYPYKCTQCLEVTTNLENLFLHYRKDHNGEKTATFKKKLMPWIPEWIDSFLKSQLPNFQRRGRILQPTPYCPVCESSVKKEDIIMLPAHLIQPRKQLMHIFKHLVYEPFVCVLCQKEGRKFTVADFDDRAYEHVMKIHSDSENELLAKIFQKSRYIKPLEGYISSYLTQAGVSTKRRIPEKIPNFARNKFKNELIKTNQKTQLSSNNLLLNDQSDPSSLLIGHLIDNHSFNLSNQTKANFNLTPTTQFNSPPSSINKPIFNPPTFKSSTLLMPNSSTLSPSNGTNGGVNHQITGLNQPLPSCLTLTLLPKHPNINGITPSQPILLTNNIQPPSFIQLPCGQIMVRNNQPPPTQPPPFTVQQIPQQFTPPNPSKNSSGLFSDPPIILRRPSLISPPTEHPKQNLAYQANVAPNVANILSDNYNGVKHDLDFTSRSYLCFFCKEMVNFESFLGAISHFSEHLNYNPVKCLICGERFPDIDAINEHFIESHPHRKVCRDSNETCDTLLYYISQDEPIEKWIEEFLAFQVSGQLESLKNCDISSYCFICKSIQKNCRIPNRGSHKNNGTITPTIEVLRQHINIHLNYKPYECFLCSQQNAHVKFTSIGDTAFRHLKTHGFIPNDVRFVREFFLYRPIIELESYVKNYLIKEFYPYANCQVNGRGNKGLINFDPTPINFNGSECKRNYARSPPSPETKRLFTDSNQFISSTRSSSSSSSIYKSKLPVSSTVACYHCKLTINGIRDLVTHCKSVHPTLSIASYCLPNESNLHY